jgi:hypothetical protein
MRVIALLKIAAIVLSGAGLLLQVSEKVVGKPRIGKLVQ